MVSFSRYASLRVPIDHCLRSTRGHGIGASTRLLAKDVEEVPVATYAKDKTAQRMVLSVDGSKSDPSPISTKDIQRKATPFDKAVVPRMTPTFRA